jgi:hypothetical protein
MKYCAFCRYEYNDDNAICCENCGRQVPYYLDNFNNIGKREVHYYSDRDIRITNFEIKIPQGKFPTSKFVRAYWITSYRLFLSDIHKVIFVDTKKKKYEVVINGIGDSELADQKMKEIVELMDRAIKDSNRI